MWARKFFTKTSFVMVRRYLRNENVFLSGKTMQQLKEDLRVIMGVEKGYKPENIDRNSLNKYLPKDISELPPRHIKDSYLCGIIPLSTDEDLQNKYIGNMGVLRMGRLMEDLDVFAVMVLQKYISYPKVPAGEPYPCSIVTALVTSIHFTEFNPKAAENIRILGHITCVGKTSATIAIWLEQMHNKHWYRITQSDIILAARDATNTFACLINPLVPLDAKEEAVMKESCKKKELIKLQEKSSLTKTLPTLEEQHIIHNLFLTGCGKQISASRKLPKGCKWMENSSLHSSVFSFPADRNLHNTVFGGFIMRIAMELGLGLCIMYSKGYPKLIGINDISFKRPIAVGSIILMHAHVVYTELNFVQITILVDAVNRRVEMENSSNIFYLTYKLPNVATSVLPYTYQESMMYIDGLRHFRRIMKEGKIKQDPIYSPDDDPARKK